MDRLTPYTGACCDDYRDAEVFPAGNKLPSTNLPASATGPVQRSLCLSHRFI